jgi:hypothetical protein
MASKLDLLKDKWENWTDYYPGIDNLAAGKFLMRLKDCRGEECTETTLTFDSQQDAAAFLRFRHIPAILDNETGLGTKDDKYPEAETYLAKLDPKRAKKIKSLLTELDDLVKSSKVSEATLEDLRIDFNSVFGQGKEDNSVKAWAPLKDYLRSECFEDAFEKLEELGDDAAPAKHKRRTNEDEDEYGEEMYIDDEEESEDETHKELRVLLAKDKFEENNDEHILLAANFLEEQEIV